MEAVDGLLLTGGGDIVSLVYGEEPHPKAAGQDPVRDGAEFAAVRIALERGLPILGICRGIQSLNVALGGTLVQDVPSQVAGACQHSTRAGENVLGHTVDVEPGSLLARDARRDAARPSIAGTTRPSRTLPAACASTAARATA